MRRGLSIARGMAVIALLALACGTLRLFLEFHTLGGMLPPALGLQAGLIGVLLTRGRFRRFCIGTAAACVVIPALYLLVLASTQLLGGPRHLTISLKPLPAPLRQLVIDELDSPLEIGPVTGAVIDLMLGLPQLLVALVIGLLTAFVRLPRRRPRAVAPAEAPEPVLS